MPQWFSYLHGLRRCSNGLHRFLDMIQQHMLVTKPESRWSIEKVLESLTDILDQSCRGGDATKDHHVARPQTTLRPNHFPPLWHDDGSQQRIQRHANDQPSTQWGLISGAHIDGSALSRDSTGLTDDVTSTRDMERLLNSPKDYVVPSRSLGLVHHENARPTSSRLAQQYQSMMTYCRNANIRKISFLKGLQQQSWIPFGKSDLKK